jgi:hypothetical protein
MAAYLEISTQRDEEYKEESAADKGGQPRIRK